MNEDSPLAIPVLLFLVGILFLGFLLFLRAYEAEKHENGRLRSEAVQKGYAEYKVDAEGNPEWQWKQQPAESPR